MISQLSTQKRSHKLPELIDYYEICNKSEGKSPKTVGLFDMAEGAAAVIVDALGASEPWGLDLVLCWATTFRFFLDSKAGEARP